MTAFAREHIAALLRCKTADYLETYLCYTTTYNPKRAIYDIQFYAGTPKMNTFAPTLTAYTGNTEANCAQTGYGIVPVFLQCGQSISKWNSEPGKKSYLIIVKPVATTISPLL